MKVVVFVCGEGLGHTTRCQAVAAELERRGHECVLGAYGYSKTHLERAGFDVVEVPNEIKLVGKAGALDLAGSVGETLKTAKPHQFPKITKLLRDEKPDVVVSDSYYVAAILAKMQGYPVAMILNQTKMDLFFESRGVSLQVIGKMIKEFTAKVFQSLDAIVIPDFAPPDCVTGNNLGFNKSIEEKVHYVGPLVRTYPSDTEAADYPHPYVFSLIGGFGYREKLLHSIMAAANTTPDVHYTLVTGPNSDPSHFEEKTGDNVEVEAYVENVFPQLAAADLVIAPGGHSTLMECVAFGTPVLSVPDIDHREQENNADGVEDLGIGHRLGYESTPEEIVGCIREVLEDDSMHHACQRLKDKAEKSRGAAVTVDLLETLKTR